MRGVKSTQQRWGCNILCAIFSDEAELFHFPFERTSRKLSTKTKLSLGKNWARVIFSWIKRVYDYCFAGRKLGLNEKLVGILNFGRLIIFLCPFLESNTSLYLIGFWLDTKSVNHLMRWLIPIGQMSDGLGHYGGCKLTLYAVDHILGCGPWGSSQIENAGAECIFLCELPLCENWWPVVGFSDDWPPTCETFILWRKLCVSLKKGDKKHHFWAKKIPLKLTPEFVATQNGVRITHNMVPLPSKSEAESACFYNNKKNTISPAENVVLSRGSGPTSPIRPWGPTWTWMSCPASRLFIHDCVTWNTEYLLDKSKLTWLEHHSFKAFGSDLSSSYAILHCENCAAVRCESRHMRLALPPKLHHYCCFCWSNNNSFKQCCSWS